MSNKKAIAVLLVSAFSVPAAAAEAGGYGLASFGATKFKVDSQLLGSEAPSFDRNSTGFKLGGGAMFHRNFGAEAAYVDFGKATATASDPATGASASATVKASGAYLAGIAAFPVNDQLSIFGKLGFIAATVKVGISVPGDTESTKKRSTNLMYGVGAQYDVNARLGIRAEYEHFDKMGESIDVNSPVFQTGKHSVDMLSVGAVLRFK